MPRVQIYEGGSVTPQGTTNARQRAADFGPSMVGVGLQALGQTIGDAAKKADEIEDVKARVQANQLAVEHSKLSREIGRRVKETLGEGAEAAANSGTVDLEKGTKDILGRASPRARLLLESELGQRNVAFNDSFLEHGFTETKSAFEATSVARISSTLENAADEDDEAKALDLLKPVTDLNAQRARFFGKGSDWETSENQRVISQFFRSRALKLTVGNNGSAHAAIEYATKNRAYLVDEDYNAIVSAYNDNALDELATSFVDGAPMPSATVTVDPDAQSEQSRHLDPIAFFKTFVSPWEGGDQMVVDSNGALAKYGVNAEHNPGVNVRALSEDGAAEIFSNKYFKGSGADKLPPALAAVHADTYWLNQKEAARILKESGGDVDKYIGLRRSFLNGLATKQPAKFGKYQKGWENRTKALKDFADRQGTDGTPLAIEADTSLQATRDAVMARTDIGLSLKRKIISRMEARQADARQERAMIEDEAARDLTTSLTALGDQFTDVKQLPQDAWLKASPATREALTTAAKSNKERKPVGLDVEAQIGFLQTFAPEKLADPKVQQELARKGVPATRLADLAQQGGAALGRGASAKPAPVPTAQLEAIARPAFEAQGIFLWTQEEKKKGKDVERQQDAQRQIRALSMLRGYANQWAANNPGKVADESLIRGWVANVSRRVQTHNGGALHFFDMSDDQVVLSMSETDRRTIIRTLRDNGLPPQPELIAEYYRRSYIGRQR